MGSDSLAPVIAGGAVGAAFVIFVSLYFNSVVPIIAPIVPSFAPLPRIVMVYNDTQYLGNLTTFGWGRDMLYITDISVAFGSDQTTISLEKGSTLTFLANDYYNDTLHVLPVSVYVYQYPSTDFLGTLEVSNHTVSGNVFVVDDTLADGDYYLRVNHQNRENGDSVSYYFKVRIS